MMECREVFTHGLFSDVFTGLPHGNPVRKSVKFLLFLIFLLLGYHMAIQSENEWNLSFLIDILIIFSVSGRDFIVAPLLSSVFVRRVFCAYFSWVS